MDLYGWVRRRGGNTLDAHKRGETQASCLPSRRNIVPKATAPPAPASANEPGSGTAEIASICVRPLRTSIRRKLALCTSTLLPALSRAHDKSKPAPPAEPL